MYLTDREKYIVFDMVSRNALDGKFTKEEIRQIRIKAFEVLNIQVPLEDREEIQKAIKAQLETTLIQLMEFLK